MGSAAGPTRLLFFPLRPITLKASRSERGKNNTKSSYRVDRGAPDSISCGIRLSSLNLDLDQFGSRQTKGGQSKLMLILRPLLLAH